MKKTALRIAMLATVISSTMFLSSCGESSSPAATTTTTATAPTQSVNNYFPTIREAAPGLDGYTVYRPADLTAVGGTVPVLLFGPGGCKTRNDRYADTLGAIAAHGFVVVAYGAFDAPTIVEPTTTMDPTKMTKSMDWAKSIMTSKPGYAAADPNKLGVFGTSCGGIETLIAGQDARVKSVAGINTGFFDAGTASSVKWGNTTPDDVNKLHTPLLLMGGGTYDNAYPQSLTNYAASTKNPTVMAQNINAGHNGLWVGLRYTLDPNDPTKSTGSTVDYTVTVELIDSLVKWFDYTLNGNAAQASYFIGADNGLSKVPGWTVQYKNFK